MQRSLETMNSEIYVVKRDGRREEVHFDKVQHRIKMKSNGLIVNPNLVAQRVCSRIYDGVSTSELDELAGQICTSLMTDHPDYGILATRIVISNNHKNTPSKFSEAMFKLEGLISKTVLDIVKEKGDLIDAQIDNERDYLIDYFGFKTLQKGYLLKIDDKIIERPQYLFMRVSLGLHDWDLENAFKSYNMLSQKYFSHATPTLFHAGTPYPQLLSCFLLGTEDSVDGIYKNIADCAKISKWAGGIGVHISNIRGRNAHIKSSNGKGNGIVPMLRVYNETAKYINQSGKRNGSIAVYLEPYHPDIMDFLDLRKNNGAEDARARDLFLALIIPDLFMRKVEEAVKNPDRVVNWCLFDPSKCSGLNELYGENFDRLYEKYESEGLAKEIIDIGKLWKKIMSSQIETGTPYILFKDRINELSNQSNIGTIKSSNLCVDGSTEVLTKDGFVEIKELENQNVEIWNGFDFSKVLIKKTGENQEMQKIEFSNGEQLVCTPYHKFYVRERGKTLEIRGGDLRKGMKLMKYKFPLLDFEKEDFTIVPLSCKKEIRLKWLEKYVDNNGKLKIVSEDIGFVMDVKKMLNTLGCDCKIISEKSSHRIVISKYFLYKLQKLGLNIICDKPNRETSEIIKVKVIQHNYKIGDTFCFNEEKRHFGVFNRILTGQCAEIVEYSDSKEYACCCLASISLGELVDIGKIEGHVKIYSKSGCPYCDKALELLPKDCEKIVLDDDNERKSFYNELNKPVCEGERCYINNKKFNTVPQIFIGDNHIGGYTDLVKYLKPKVNYDKLEEICETLVRNLNKVIDINFYPVVETSRSNFRHRPLGIGVQGFSCMLFKLGIPFESEEAKIINKQIFEAIQYYCLKASCKIAKEREVVIKEFLSQYIELPVDRDLDLPCVEYKGQRFTQNELKLEKYQGAYLTFEGSPLSQGYFQWEKCGVTDLFIGIEKWDELRKDIMTYGVRNSLLTALMPTASTSQILGNNECFEPITSNIYTRRTLAGDFVVLNKYLVRDLIRDGLWCRELKDLIVAENGSVANLSFLPDKTRELYKTVWEIKQKALIDLSADRTPFICQTQSLNLFFEEPKVGTLGSALIYGWKRGLKTGSYYIRSRPKVQAQQFTIDPKIKEKFNYEVCESCSG